VHKYLCEESGRTAAAWRDVRAELERGPPAGRSGGTEPSPPVLGAERDSRGSTPDHQRCWERGGGGTPGAVAAGRRPRAEPQRHPLSVARAAAPADSPQLSPAPETPWPRPTGPPRPTVQSQGARASLAPRHGAGDASDPQAVPWVPAVGTSTASPVVPVQAGASCRQRRQPRSLWPVGQAHGRSLALCWGDHNGYRCSPSPTHLPGPEGSSCLRSSGNITEASSIPAAEIAISPQNKPSSLLPSQYPCPRDHQGPSAAPAPLQHCSPLKPQPQAGRG